ncbi:NEL-type E3 ubiquitin ligase domain-containing protein [Pseudomonas sp. UMAB-40]|uniref:NEL-type E3 ubiquitin ligase domain-containing protein n=1 Tax=Pseudomonas sp. UMAB-40 TaxID=1365407 RepID=UPI001C5A16D1|nr:NEL-type E3 ubiquitin ligase domain-containing protein [Pseudomonas sp. UMAB-40]
MSSPPTNSNTPVLTPDQQGVFFDLIKSNAPVWLLTASSQLRRELYESLSASHGSRGELADLLKGFKSPESFCTPLLAQAMSDKLGAPLDTVGVIFQHVRSTSSLLGLRKKLVLPIDRDLLSAACENFELSETVAGNYSDTSLIYIPEIITGTVNKVLSIEPHEFAALCRKLDLGKQYQAHVKSLFQSVSGINELRNKYIAHAKNSFEAQRHIALMKKTVSAEMHQALKSVKEQQPVKLGNNTLGYQALEMFDVTINGAMFIGPVEEHDDDDYRCVVYLPDDPLHPLKEYASFKDFEMELSGRLRASAFRQFFMRYIKLADRPAFLPALEKGLFAPASSPLPANSVYVSLSGVDIQDDMFQEIFRQYANQVIGDARLLVVPTDDEDEKSRLGRLETYKAISLNVLLFGASFVPFVGHILLAVTVMQLLSEVYEGVASWSRGEQEQATDYLFDTIENLILMAAFAAGSATVGTAYKTIRTSVFIERLRKVPGVGARGRLWNPDLTAYQQNRRLPRALAPDPKGLHWMGGQAYLPIDTSLYAVRPKTATELWEVIPPVGSDSTYSPELETNDVGAWRHDSELPQEWDRLKLFRRFGYTRDKVPDTAATQILAVCGIDDTVLRQAHVDRSRPPALLVDTVQRFRADAAVTDFIEQLKTPSSAALADPDLQLHLLTASSQWPDNSAIKVVNTAGRQVGFYGAATALSGKTVNLNQDTLHKGQLHTSLLTAMDSAQRQSLLGANTPDATARATALTKVVADQAEISKPALFERIYKRTEVPSDARVTVLMNKIAHLPSAIAEELVRHAEAGELSSLEAGNVPLRLAEEARRYLQRVQVSRAYEGLYLNAVGGLSTDRLVLDTLEQLPGWTANARVQIQASSGVQSESTSIGVADAAEKVQVDVHPDRYSVSVGDITPATPFVKRTREQYFKALWHGLSAQRKTALGVNLDDGGVALRQKITQLALTRRTAIAQLIDARPPRAGYTSPMGLADRHVASPSFPVPGPVLIKTTHDVLVRRALELYPMHSPVKIHALVNALGQNLIEVLKKLEALRLQFQTIRQVLSHWVSRQTWHLQSDGSRLEVSRLSKYRTAQAIIRCWRNEPELTESGDSLHSTLRFDTQPLGELPVIVGDFSHVERLVLDGVGASAGLNAFLQNFGNLRSLSLRGNHLTRLPLALSSMSRLVNLDLGDNLIQLTAESVTQLAGMTSLQSVNLAFNPTLARVPDISRLQHLEYLNLQGTGIKTWPSGASSLPKLRELDLRDNQIETLPEDVFKGHAVPNKGTNLHGNPLSADTLKKIVMHQQKTGVSLGIIASEYRRSGAYSPTEAQSSAWLAGRGSTETQYKRGLWDSLRAYPESRGFFNVLARLSETADYKRLFSHFSQRVWNVLEAATEDDRLRRRLFRLAQVGRFSADGYSALFSEMEVQVLFYRAMAAALTGPASVEQQLVTLLRGLFRLYEVEGFALADINARTGSQSGSYEYALEISLAYRVGLAERLDLPAQPRAVTSALNVEVAPAALERAFQKVLTTERTSALLEWMITQRFWVEYLEATHSDHFLTIADRSARDFARVEGQAELSRTVATERQNAIFDNYKNERRALVRQLTGAALMRHPAPPVPGPSSGSGAAQ